MSLAFRRAAVVSLLLLAVGSGAAGEGDRSSAKAPRISRAVLGTSGARPARRPGAHVDREETYLEVRTRLEVQRRSLAEAYAATSNGDTEHADHKSDRNSDRESDRMRRRAELEAIAAAALTAALTREILPRWLGVPWSRGAASAARQPGPDGQPAAAVHCASFIIAALEGAGVRFAHRDELARAPALRILESVNPETRAEREAAAREGIAKWQGTIAALERELIRRGDGIYLLGLAQHIGFAVVSHGADGTGAVRLLHASRAAGRVVEEPMASSSALLRSRGAPIFATRLIHRELIRRWLAGAALGPR